MKIIFVYWGKGVIDDIVDIPFFNVDGDTLALPTLEERRWPVPDYPSFEEWQENIDLKRNCRFCYATTRCSGDWVHHMETNHRLRAA